MPALDTQSLPAAERADAFPATVSASCSSSMASSIHPNEASIALALPYVHGWKGGGDSAELMRALVSAAAEGRRTSDAPHSSMQARVQTYVRKNLRDPDLTPARIAAANAMSLRALYKLYETLGQSLEQSIIEQRLQGARADLSASRRRNTSIAAVARAWGFSSPSFFSSRFRKAFGVTPRQLVAMTSTATIDGRPSDRCADPAATVPTTAP